MMGCSPSATVKYKTETTLVIYNCCEFRAQLAVLAVTVAQYDTFLNRRTETKELNIMYVEPRARSHVNVRPTCPQQVQM